MTETLRARDLAVIPATTLAVMILNVLASIAVVWVYATFWNPGHPEAFYSEFAQEAAPPSSVVFGAILVFAAGWLIARGRSVRAAVVVALLVVLLYVAIDLLLFLAVGATGEIWMWGLLSWSTKLVAAAAGAALKARRQARSPVAT
jgi:hypothetical protein